MSTLATITTLMPLVIQAAQTIQSFRGDANAASGDSKIADAADVISAIAPLVEGFKRGIDVTETDVREALAGMDDALSAFDLEIVRQGG